MSLADAELSDRFGSLEAVHSGCAGCLLSAKTGLTKTLEFKWILWYRSAIALPLPNADSCSGKTATQSSLDVVLYCNSGKSMEINSKTSANFAHSYKLVVEALLARYVVLYRKDLV